MEKLSRKQQEFIACQLRHASYKKYENYVLSQLYWKLASKGIVLKMVTQQTVFREDADAHVAYLDAYFPALNIQVEVDEAQHKHSKQADEKREEDVMKVLGALKLAVEPDVLRVDVTEDIDSQVDKCVAVIAERWKQLAYPYWLDDIDPVQELKNYGKICVSDNIMFPLKNELLNALGARTAEGKEYPKLGTQSSSLVKLGSKKLWFPCISDNPATGWMNSYDVSSGIFKTQDMKVTERSQRKWKKREDLQNSAGQGVRHIFFKAADAFNNRGYKYFGTFICMHCDAKSQCETWQKVGEEDLLAVQC
jgi:very-short-patch-repair endonuclease